MGSGASSPAVDASVGATAAPPPGAFESGKMRKGKPRASMMFDVEGADKMVPSMVKEMQTDVFQIRIPPGQMAGSVFGAMCGKRYVKVEVPADCEPGDLIEIDLRPDGTIKEEEETGKGIGGIDSSENLKECARMFIKYGAAETFKLPMTQLTSILINEFGFEAGSENIKREIMMVDIDNSKIITFQEFVIWFDHLKLRMQVEKLLRERETKTRTEDDDTEQQEMERLRNEQENLRKQVQLQKDEFEMQIAALKAEKERLLTENPKRDVGDHDQKINTLVKHKRSNETMIEKMKEDYILLQSNQAERNAQHKEIQRKKLEAKIAAKKNSLEALPDINESNETD